MRNRSFSLLLTLTAGILSFILLSTLENRIEGALSSRARDLLGADLALSSRRWIRSEEMALSEKLLREGTSQLTEIQTTEVLELFTMVSSFQKTPQLIELQAIEPSYPLVGALEFASRCSAQQDCVHGDPALAIRWGLEPGISPIKIGQKEFIWGGSLERDTSRSLRGGNLAPRVFIKRSDLPATGLLRSGATFTTRKLYALTPAPDPITLDKLSKKINASITDPGIQIQIPKDAAADEGRLLSNVSDFLGLTSLVGLLLAFIGCYWLLRRLIQQNAQSWAIYRVFAPRPIQADLPFWRLALKLSMGATLLALALAQITWWLASPLLSRFLLMEGRLATVLPALTGVHALTLSIGTLALALIPSLRFLKRQNLMDLLKNPGILAQRSGFTGMDLGILILLLLGVARWVAHSWKVALLFMVGLSISTALALGLGYALLRLAEGLSQKLKNPSTRLSILALARLQASSLLLWTTFTLGALLMALMPMLESSLRLQLSDPRSAGPVPSLFLFDIQEEQLDGVSRWAKESDTELQFVTPLIRGRLLKINGESFEKIADAPTTREEEREARFRNRGFNLTYRSDLTPSERLIAGQNFHELGIRTPETPEAVTVEKRFAERLKIKMGDRLLFDIQGVPIDAQVVGLRQVQWTSFQPNFFIVFEPRALRDAPKTYLASLPSMDSQKREKVQRSLFESFSNVSTVDVTRLMETLLEGFSQISQALGLMAVLSTLAGGFAILSIARLRTEERLGELQLLKLLGQKKESLLRSVSSEFAVLSGAAALTGLILATTLAGALSRWIFDSPVLLPSAPLAIGLVAGFIWIGGLLGWVASRRAVNEPPQTWLKTLSQET